MVSAAGGGEAASLPARIQARLCRYYGIDETPSVEPFIELAEGARCERLEPGIEHLSYRDIWHHLRTIDSFTRIAAQALAVIKDLNLDATKINPLGGAIALGHPLGATGAIRAATVVHGLRRRKQKYGMVTMCIGTGMGAAGIFEAL